MEPLAKDLDLTISEAAVQTVIDEGLRPLVAANFHQSVEHLYKRQIVTTIYAYLVKQEFLCQYPADWWQAFKDRWYPEWLKRRWPVRYTIADARLKFPFMPIPDSYIDIVKKQPGNWRYEITEDTPGPGETGGAGGEQ